MTSFRAAFLAALCSIFLASCGDTFRPIAIPQPGTVPPFQASKTAQVITANGQVTNFNMSGGTVTGQAQIGQGPVATVLLGTRVYAANQADNTLSVYTAAAPQNTAPATVTLSPGSTPQALETNGLTVYVAFRDLDQIGLVATSNNTQSGTIDLNSNGFAGASPVALAFNSAFSKLFSANRGRAGSPAIPGNVSIIDPVTNGVIGTVGEGICLNPVSLARATDTAFVYVICKDSNNVLVVDSNAPSNFTAVNVPVGLAPTSASYDAKNKRLIVTNSASNSVSVLAEDLALAPSALHGVTTVALGASPVATAALPDGSRIYVANANGSVTVIASATLTVKTNIPLGGAGQQIGASTDSTRVAVTTTGPDVLQVIDTTTDTLNASHALAGPPRALLIF